MPDHPPFALPLRVEHDDGYDFVVYDAEGESVVVGLRDEVAAYIVRAVNAHHEMAHALDLAISEIVALQKLLGPEAKGGVALKVARAALAEVDDE